MSTGITADEIRSQDAFAIFLIVNSWSVLLHIPSFSEVFRPKNYLLLILNNRLYMYSSIIKVCLNRRGFGGCPKSNLYFSVTYNTFISFPCLYCSLTLSWHFWETLLFLFFFRQTNLFHAAACFGKAQLNVIITVVQTKDVKHVVKTRNIKVLPLQISACQLM